MATTTRSAPGSPGTGAGALLRRWRERALLTQEELAARAGVDARTVRRLEGEAPRRPRSSTLRLVIDALALDEVEQARLRAALGDVPSSAGTTNVGSTVPRQLPADPLDFAGRTDELDYLLAGPGEGTTVWTIDGMAGIGKTTLAVRAAHACASRYPDGQLFLDMHGASGRPLDTADALDRMLRSLDVPGEAVPPGLDARAAMYRSRIAARRVLILLDDVADEHQVQPLLPGAGANLVIVTSRRRLAGLDRSRTVSLDVLPAADAVRLFTVSAESPDLLDMSAEAVAEAVELCGRVPLAIRIAAARLRSRPTWTLADLIPRLRAGRLDELVAGARGMGAALDTSVAQLDADHQRAFDLLGLMISPDVSLPVASALIDADHRRTREILGVLVECHLLDEVRPDRFAMHALVREHARRRGAARGAEASAAIRRSLDQYVAATAAAVRIAYPYVQLASDPELPVEPGTAQLDVPVSRPDARRWLDAELDDLLAAALMARESGLGGHVGSLSGLLERHLTTTARHRSGVPLHQAALGCARRDGDRGAEALALNRLAFVRRRLGVPDHAATLYRRALDLAREADSALSAATALIGLSNIIRLRDDYVGAGDLLSEALALARTTDGAAALPEVLVHRGHVHRQRAEDDEAEACLSEALESARRVGHDQVRLDALFGLGWMRVIAGDDRAGGELLDHALEIAREGGHLMGEANALAGLGHILVRQGEQERAVAFFAQVEALADRIGSSNWRFEAILGHALACRTSDPRRALELGDRALAIAEEMGHRGDAARAHDLIADVLERLGDRRGAAEHLDRTLDLMADLGVDLIEDGGITVASIAERRALLGAMLEAT